MSQNLNFPNFTSKNLVNGSNTQLTASVSPGSSSLTVANAENYTSGFLLIGAPGSENAEMLPNTSVNSGVSIALTSNTVLQHSQYDAVHALFGNQINVYRAPDAGLGQMPADSAFIKYATITIDPNSSVTAYTDSSGGGGYWYNYTYFNSGSSSETALDDALAVRGSFTVNYCTLDEIREEAGFRSSSYITDLTLDRHRQAAQDEINGALDEFYETPFQPPVNDFLKRITIRLAAGYARLQQYSQVADAKVNGQDMVDGAQADLEDLITKQRVLTDKQGHTLDQVGGTGEANGWPDASASSTPSYQGGAPRLFRMGDIQGQPLTTNPDGTPSGNLYYGRRW